VRYVNPPSCDADDVESDSDYGDEEQHLEFVEYVASKGAPLTPETPPGIPLSVDGPRDSFSEDEPIHDEGREFASFLGSSPLNRTGEIPPMLSCDEMSRIDYETLDDDDEDSLPPFDDWYTGGRQVS
jgi:hypothetical protein